MRVQVVSMIMDSEDVNNVVIGKVFSQESVPEKQLSGN